MRVSMCCSDMLASVMIVIAKGTFVTNTSYLVLHASADSGGDAQFVVRVLGGHGEQTAAAQHVRSVKALNSYTHHR